MTLIWWRDQENRQTHRCWQHKALSCSFLSLKSHWNVEGIKRETSEVRLHSVYKINKSTPAGNDSSTNRAPGINRPLLQRTITVYIALSWHTHPCSLRAIVTRFKLWLSGESKADAYAYISNKVQLWSEQKNKTHCLTKPHDCIRMKDKHTQLKISQ